MKPIGGLNSLFSAAGSVAVELDATLETLGWSAAGVSSPDAGTCANAATTDSQSANAIVTLDIATPPRPAAQLVLHDSTLAHTLRDWSKFACSCSRLTVMARNCSSL